MTRHGGVNIWYMRLKKEFTNQFKTGSYIFCWDTSWYFWKKNQLSETTEMNTLKKAVGKPRLDHVTKQDIRQQCGIQPAGELILKRWKEWGRSQWPRCLRYEQSSLSRTLGSWVRIPLKAWMFVFILFVLGSGLATGRSPVQGVLPTVLN
jgi:hypothetical protein